MTVSIVVVSYNYGRYLRKCLSSILAQSQSRFEVIVIDDGSTDESAEIVRAFQSDPRVSYHYQPHQGQAVAKNAGIRLLTGELVAFLDADDLWYPDKLAKQVPLFANSCVGVTYTGFTLIDEQDQPVPSEPPHGYLAFRRGRVTKWLGFDNFVPFSSAIVRRSLLDHYGAFDEALNMGIDWDIWLRLSCVTEFDFVEEPLLAYRVHANQMSTNKDGRLAAADFIFRRFVEQHPDAFSPRDLEEIAYYTACSRAASYRGSDLRRSTALLLKAWRMSPLSPDSYLEMLRNALAVLKRET
jgi:glycosyltransferase involved in cell wall biosynthesis